LITPAANNHRNLSLIINAPRKRREYNRLFRANHGTGRLQKNDQVFRDRVAKFGGVLSIVPAYAYDFAGHCRCKQPHPIKTPSAFAEPPLRERASEAFANGTTFHDAV